MTRHLRLAGALLLAALLGTACASSTPSSPSGPASNISAIVINGLRTSMEVGDTAQLSALLKLSDGTEKSLTSTQVAWQTSDVKVATISAAGLLTIVDAGSADVSGAYSGVSASTHLTALFPPPPSAVLTISVSGQDEQRDVPVAVLGLSPVTFDMTRSSGSGLQYQVDFGDGTTSSGVANASHVYDTTGPVCCHFDIRATVTDRFARTDTVKTIVYALPLKTGINSLWLSPQGPIDIDLHQGRNVAGRVSLQSGASYTTTKFTGQLSGQRDIHLVLENGVEFSGIVVVAQKNPPSGLKTLADRFVPEGGSDRGTRLEFIVHGGPNDGQQLVFYHYETY